MRIVADTCNDSDPRMPHGKKIPHHLIGCILIINHCARHLRIVGIGISQYNRNTILTRNIHVAPVPGHIDNSVYHNRRELLYRRLQHRIYHTRVIKPGTRPSGIQSEILHNRPVSVIFTGLHRPVKNGRHRELRQILRNDSDRHGSLSAESLCNAVRAISPLLNHRHDPQSGRFSDVASSIQNIGNRSRRNPAFLCYFLDCYHFPVPPHV